MAYVDTNGIRTWYEDDAGPEPKREEPLLLLHGLTSSSGQWAEVRPMLAAERRVIVYDLRGHGRTDAPDNPDACSMALYAADMLALLDALAVERAHVLGSSFGGMVALEFALRYPRRVQTLILADTSAGPRCVELSEAIAAREDGIDAALAYARAHGKEALVAWQIESDPALIADPRLRERFLSRWQTMTLSGYLGAGKARAERPDHHDDLHRLTMPVLVIAGDRDVLVPAAEYLHTHIPRSALRLINHAGHPAVADQPHGFVAVVRGFLAGIDAPMQARAGGP